MSRPEAVILLLQLPLIGFQVRNLSFELLQLALLSLSKCSLCYSILFTPSL